MKNIMFLGDSLTAGVIGSSYLDLLNEEESLKEFNLINAGENGYTMAGLLVKLGEYLIENSSPDILIIEGGANDILLPHMQSMNSSWDPFIRKLTRHGSIPALTPQDFRKQCRRNISAALEGGITSVFMCTIPCLGEDLDSELNRQRAEYNRVIRETCREFSENSSSCLCIDAAVEVEAYLGNRGAPWLFGSPLDLQKDAQIIVEQGEESLCRKRGLKLTIDGAHLNRKGAQLFSSLIIKSLKEYSIIL